MNKTDIPNNTQTTPSRKPRPPNPGFSEYQTQEEKNLRRNIRKKLRRIKNGSVPLSPAVQEFNYRTTVGFRQSTSIGAKLNWENTRELRMETFSSPDFKLVSQESARLRWGIPGSREAHAKLMKDFYSINENRAAHSANMKKALDTPEFRLKCSNRLGPLAPNWQGGISFEPYCWKFNEDFRLNVRTFFDNKCVLCLYEGLETPKQKRALSVHHIHYDKRSLCNDESPRMFAPLCDHHHSITLGDREFWEALLEGIIIDVYNSRSYYPEEEWAELKPQIFGIVDSPAAGWA